MSKNNYKEVAENFNKDYLLIFLQKNITSKNFSSFGFFLESLAKQNIKKAENFKKLIISKNIIVENNLTNTIKMNALVKNKLFIGNGQEEIDCSYVLNSNTKQGLLDSKINKISASTILHPVTLRPYIPGSSIHGAFRSYLVLQYGLKKEHKKLIDFIFGNIDKDNGHIGLVCCFDAHPIAQDAGTLPDDSLEVSVISGGMKDGNIIPLNFINVKKGTKFQFNMRVRPLSESCINTLININNKTDKIEFNLKKDDPLDIQISTIQNRLYALFKEFLTHGSIGARESVGWGEFENVTGN